MRLAAARVLAVVTGTWLGVVGMWGCGEVSRTFDCAAICDNFETCVDSSLDQINCTNRCEDQGDASQAFADRAEACENCQSDLACAELSQCNDICEPVVRVVVGG